MLACQKCPLLILSLDITFLFCSRPGWSSCRQMEMPAWWIAKFQFLFLSRDDFNENYMREEVASLAHQTAIKGISRVHCEIMLWCFLILTRKRKIKYVGVSVWVEILDSPSFIAYLRFSSDSPLSRHALPYRNSARPQEVPVVCTSIPRDWYVTSLFHNGFQRTRR